MKKPIIFLLLTVLSFMFCFNFVSFKFNRTNALSFSNDIPQPEISAKSALLIEYNSGKVIYEKNSNERLPIASMTKLASLSLIFDAINKGAIKENDMVMVSESAAKVGGSSAFLDAGSKYKVADLIKTIVVASANDSTVALAEFVAGSEDVFVSKMNTDEKLSAKYIFPRFQDFLLPDDIVFSETGIISYGVAAMDLPKGANLYNQVLWGSIGWATPAAFGASIAAKDKRVVLLTGEGSHQLTACEISSMMRYGTKPVIIVLNNDGYTIERLLSDDPMDEFNEIAQWNYSKLPEVFTGDVWTAQARTNNEFDSVLTEAKEQQKTKMCYIEIFADKMDIPDLTKKIIECKLTNKAAKTV